MGFLFSRNQPSPQQPPKSKAQSNVQNVDVVKMKLKQARDRIRNFIAKKKADISQLDAQIREKLPDFEATRDKKPLVPLLRAKKDLGRAVEQGETRLQLVGDKLAEVEMSQVNKETIEVLEDSNRYIREVQETLEDRDWRGVLADCQNQYAIDWPDDSEEVQEDPAFQEMWAELGGNKLPQIAAKKVTVQVDSLKQEKPQLA